MEGGRHMKRIERRLSVLLGLVVSFFFLSGITPARALSTTAPVYPTAPIFLNSANWSSNAGFGSAKPRWYKESGFVDPDVVHLQGAAKQTTTTGGDPNLLGRLTPAASPNRIVYTIVHTFDGTYADIAITPQRTDLSDRSEAAGR